MNKYIKHHVNLFNYATIYLLPSYYFLPGSSLYHKHKAYISESPMFFTDILQNSPRETISDNKF